MKKSSKWLVSGLALSLAVALGACAAYPDAKDSKAMIDVAEKKLGKITSAESSIVTTLDMKKDGGKYSKVITSKVSAIAADTVAFRNQTTTTVNGRKSSETDYIALEGKEKVVNVYNYDGKKWTVMPSDRETVIADKKAQPFGLLNELKEKKADQFKIVGEDTIGGLSVSILETTIIGEDIKPILQTFGGEDVIQNLFQFNMKKEESRKAYEELLEGGYAALGDEDKIVIKVYVSDAQFYPLRTTVDATYAINRIVKAMLVSNTIGSESARESAEKSITIEKCIIQVDMKNFNRVPDIKLPAAAEKAEKIEAVEKPSASPAASLSAGAASPSASADASAEASESPSPSPTETNTEQE